MNKLGTLIVLLLVVALGLLTVNLFKGESVPAAKADSMSGDLVAVSGGNNGELLYVLLKDTGGGGANPDEAEGTTVHLAAYTVRSNKIQLLSVRELTYDLKVIDFPERGHSPTAAEMRRNYRANRENGD